MASPSALTQVPVDSSNYWWLVTKLFKVSEICVIVSKASGAAQVPNKCQYDAKHLGAELFFYKQTGRLYMGINKDQNLKSSTYKTKFGNVG